MIDLGAERPIRGFRYLARQDGGWNGASREVRVLGRRRRPESFGEPVATATFEKRDSPGGPLRAGRGRYVRVRVLSEVNGGPWASIAELGVVGEGLEQAVRQADR